MSKFQIMLQRLNSKTKKEDPPPKKKPLNCWDVKKCGKENKCAAGTNSKYNGFFGGKNGGRFCAFISGTLCFDNQERTTLEKFKICAQCEFYADIISRVFPNTK